MTWSIEKELVKLSGKGDIQSALHFLFAERVNCSSPIKQVKDWHRSGAETYAFIFSVDEQTFFLKACCPSSTGSSVDNVLDNWINRRKIFSSSGVSTPELYSFGHGLVLEEYIPYNLKDITPSKALLRGLLDDVQRISDTLIGNRFAPINPFGNLMSRGTDIVWVDFGQDLGFPDQDSAKVDTITSEALSLMQWLTIRSEKS